MTTKSIASYTMKLLLLADTVPYSNTTSFSMVSQGEEFANEVEEVLNMRLYSGSVLVVWKWTCDDTTCDDTTMFTENSEESYNNIIVQDSDDEDNVSNEGEAVDTVIIMYGYCSGTYHHL